MPKRLPRTLIAWVRSAAMVGVPTLLLAWLRDAADLHITTFVLIVPLVAAGWQGGVGDAIVASVTLFLLTHYLNVPPYYEIKPSLADIPRFALVLAIGLLGAFRGLAETRQQARAAQQAALARIARHAVESRQLQDTLVLAAATMAETLDVPFALIVEKLGPRGRVLAANHPITLTTDPFPWTDGQTQDHGRLVLVRTADASVPPDVVTLLKGLGGRPSALTAPFSVHGSVAGLLVAGTPDRRAFTPGDAEWLLSVGFVLAAAIERARLDEQRSMLLAATQEARRDAEHANRLKDEFLATLSHELRTPLNVLMGWVSMLRESELDKEGRDRALTALERNAQAQFRLVQDLLDTSQIVSGRLRLQPQLLDIVPIVRQAVDTVLPTAQSKDITIDVDLPAGDLTVRGDAVRLQQVFWNLLVNALKFTPIGGRVRLTVGRDGTMAPVQVSDNGIGIEPAFLPRVFERFSQADGTPSREHGGLGLGLAIVRHIVEMHGGDVSAFSAGRHQGSTFTVRLPLVTPATGMATTALANPVAPEGSLPV